MSDSGYDHDDTSCMRYDIDVDILRGCVGVYGLSFHAHFRRGVTLVGEFDYWALLTLSWDPL